MAGILFLRPVWIINFFPGVRKRQELDNCPTGDVIIIHLESVHGRRPINHRIKFKRFNDSEINLPANKPLWTGNRNGPRNGSIGHLWEYLLIMLNITAASASYLFLSLFISLLRFGAGFSDVAKTRFEKYVEESSRLLYAPALVMPQTVRWVMVSWVNGVWTLGILMGCGMVTFFQEKLRLVRSWHLNCTYKYLLMADNFTRFWFSTMLLSKTFQRG